MPSPVFPSRKIIGKNNLDRELRDIYAGYQTRPIITVPIYTTTEDLHKKSTVNVTTKKYMGNKKGKRYYYYRTYTQKKPGKNLVIGFPAIMQRRR